MLIRSRYLSNILEDDVESEDDDDLSLIMAAIVMSHFRLSRQALKPGRSCLGNWKILQHKVTVGEEIQCQYPNNF